MLRLAILAGAVGVTWFLTREDDQEQEPDDAPGAPEPVTREDLDELRAAIYEAAEDAKIDAGLAELPGEIRAELQNLRTATADDMEQLRGRLDALAARDGDGGEPDPVEPTEDDTEETPED